MKFMRRQRQRGVAVITALLLTTLAVTIVASLFWQQQVQVRSMENQRLHLQIEWILRGTLDWITLIMRQDARDHSTYTSLQDVWAVPLANTRIDQYIDRERVQGENFDASLSGQVFDANARFNLTNLSDGGVPNNDSLDAFKKLLTTLRIDPGLAVGAQKLVAAGQVQTVTDVNGPTPAQSSTSTSVKQMQAIELEDVLDVQGFSPEMVETLRKYVTVLPERTKVNVNTASAEVLSAVIPNLQLATAQALVTTRNRSPWRTIDDFQAALGTNIPYGPNVSVTSEWFLVQSWLKLDRASLNTEALLSRRLSGNYVTNVVWVHQN
jgi:general secretion pathway protein K